MKKLILLVVILVASLVVGCEPEPDQIVCSTGSDGVEICREMVCYETGSVTTCYDTCRFRVNDVTGWTWFDCEDD
jgi:hypothetical protein